MPEEYLATVQWYCDEAKAFESNTYSRAHEWHFDGGAVVMASASPHIVPLPYSEEANVDPEEAFIASIASCHMLFFLSLARNKSLVVERYTDHAVGIMQKNDKGKTAVTDVVLRPNITFRGKPPSQALIDTLHHNAHEMCFIANSVRSDIRIESPLV